MSKPEVAKSTAKRLTPQEWQEACRMWRSGEHTLNEIAATFDVQPAGLHKRFKRHNVIKGEHAQISEETLREELEKQSREQAEKIAQETAELKEFTLKAITLLQRRTMAEIAKASKDRKALAMITDDLKALNEAMKLIRTGYDTGHKLLGLDKIDGDKDDDLETLPLQVMTDEDVEELRRRQREEEAIMSGEVDLNDDDVIDEIEGDA